MLIRLSTRLRRWSFCAAKRKLTESAGFVPIRKRTIQHVGPAIASPSTYRGEQNLNQRESAIRRRFVPDSFQPLSPEHFRFRFTLQILYVSPLWLLPIAVIPVPSRAPPDQESV